MEGGQGIVFPRLSKLKLKVSILRCCLNVAVLISGSLYTIAEFLTWVYNYYHLLIQCNTGDDVIPLLYS